MKNNRNGMTALFVVNVAIVAGITLHKKYRPQLEQISKRYINMKTNPKTDKKSIEYKKEFSKLVEEAKGKIGVVGELVKEAWNTYSFQDIQENSLFSKEVGNVICEKLNTTYFVPTENRPMLIPIKSNGHMINRVEETLHPLQNPDYLKHICITLGLIATLNAIGLSNSASTDNLLDTFIIEDVEEFLMHEQNEINMLPQEKVQEAKIWTTEEKFEFVFLSNKSYEEKFNQILRINEISLEQAINVIMHSNLTSYENIFNFIVAVPELPHYEKMEYIVNADIATYEEKFHFIMHMKDLSVGQKIWNILEIPNISFNQIWYDLLQLEDIKQEEMIESVINTDIVSFPILFDKILHIENMTKEKFMHYILYYHASYHFMSDEALIEYIFNLDYFTKEEQLDCVWEILNKHPLDDCISFLSDFYHVSYEEYIELYQSKNTITEEQSRFLELMNRVNARKEAYILEHYDFESKEQLDEVVAGVAAEGANRYEDLYWVSNTIFNRITNTNYVNLYGTNPYRQLLAKGQFAVYEDGSYLLYLYPHNYLYEAKYELAKLAFYDMFYNAYDEIEHSYKEFRSWNTESYSNTYIVKGGNRYGNPMRESNRIVYEELVEKEVDTSSHMLVKK